MGTWKTWICSLCKHVVVSEGKPPTLRWDDGHSCMFREEPEVVKVFHEINNAFYDGHRPKDGFSTTLSVDEKYCNLVVYEDGNVLAAVSEIPRSKGKKAKVIIAPTGEAKVFDIVARQEIISMVMKAAKIRA